MVCNTVNTTLNYFFLIRQIMFYDRHHESIVVTQSLYHRWLRICFNLSPITSCTVPWPLRLVTRSVPHVVLVLFTLPVHLSSSLVFEGILAAHLKYYMFTYVNYYKFVALFIVFIYVLMTSCCRPFYLQHANIIQPIRYIIPKTIHRKLKMKQYDPQKRD